MPCARAEARQCWPGAKPACSAAHLRVLYVHVAVDEVCRPPHTEQNLAACTHIIDTARGSRTQHSNAGACRRSAQKAQGQGGQERNPVTLLHNVLTGAPVAAVPAATHPLWCSATVLLLMLSHLFPTWHSCCWSVMNPLQLRIGCLVRAPQCIELPYASLTAARPHFAFTGYNMHHVCHCSTLLAAVLTICAEHSG
jgi:hypothetical protein